MKKMWMKVMALVLVCVLGAGMSWMALADEVAAEAPETVETVVEEAPVEEAPVAEAPVVETVIEEAPAEEAPVEEIPAEEAPVEEVPTEEAPVEEPAAEEVTAEEEAAPVEDPAEEAVTEEAPVEEEIDYSGMQVIVQTNFENVIMPGDTIELTGILIGFEGFEYTLQWQYDNGSGWQDVEGANELVYTFAANETNLSYQWRLMVTL